MIVLLDTCIIIDVLQDRQPFSDDAKKIFNNPLTFRFIFLRLQIQNLM